MREKFLLDTCQIAAVAYVNDLVLVTRNVADFQSFAGIRVEDWFEPGSRA